MKNLHDSAISNSVFFRSGLFMWPNRILYFGPKYRLDLHMHCATVLHVGLHDHFYIRFNNTNWLPSRCAIIPAGINHEMRFPRGVFGKLFVEWGSLEYDCFKCRFPHSKNRAKLFYDNDVIKCFQRMYEPRFNKKSMYQHVNTLIAFKEETKLGHDLRIQKAIELTTNDIATNLSIEAVAKEVDLSSSRFRHLFVEETGVTYSQFRNWKRLLAAEVNLNTLDSLTWAAIDAGFSDASHFSRNYKNTFGVTPSSVFKSLNSFEV